MSITFMQMTFHLTVTFLSFCVKLRAKAVAIFYCSIWNLNCENVIGHSHLIPVHCLQVRTTEVDSPSTVTVALSVPHMFLTGRKYRITLSSFRPRITVQPHSGPPPSSIWCCWTKTIMSPHLALRATTPPSAKVYRLELRS